MRSEEEWARDSRVGAALGSRRREDTVTAKAGGKERCCNAGNGVVDE